MRATPTLARPLVVLAAAGMALLAACSNPPPPEDPAATPATPPAAALTGDPATTAPRRTVFDEQLKALEKAKAVERQMQEAKEAQDRAIEAEGG
jgi:hypothetical protein